MGVGVYPAGVGGEPRAVYDLAVAARGRVARADGGDFVAVRDYVAVLDGFSVAPDLYVLDYHICGSFRL